MKLFHTPKVKPALRRVGSLPRRVKTLIAVLLAAGTGLAVVASRVEGHALQVGLMMLAEVFGVYAAQLIRSTGAGARKRVERRPQPVLFAGSLNEHFGIVDFEIARSGLDRAAFPLVTPRSGPSRRAADRWS